jgi:hypothetical protein
MVPAVTVEVNTLTREQIHYAVLYAPSCCQLAAGLERLSHASFRQFLRLNPQSRSAVSEQ